MDQILMLVAAFAVCGTSGRPQAAPQVPFENFGNRVYERNLNTECQRREVSPGRFQFKCVGIPQENLTIRKEHILWLQQNPYGPTLIDIEVPNYKIEELIKAGFKKTVFPGSTINLLLRRPETETAAEVQIPETVSETPTVNLQYEPVGPKEITHYPNDKNYLRSTGPILPPLRNSFNDAFIQRPQRETSTTIPLAEGETAEVFNYY